MAMPLPPFAAVPGGNPQGLDSLQWPTLIHAYPGLSTFSLLSHPRQKPPIRRSEPRLKQMM
eukprot:5893325-Amphidinium_carterae.1